MTRQRLLWAGMGCLALAACLNLWPASKPHPVNETNFRRIQLGMTRAEVEGVLGCPPGYYTTEESWDVWVTTPIAVVGYHENVGHYCDPAARTAWYSDHGFAHLWFHDDDRVKYGYFCRFVPMEPLRVRPSLLDRLRAWLGW